MIELEIPYNQWPGTDNWNAVRNTVFVGMISSVSGPIESCVRFGIEYKIASIGLRSSSKNKRKFDST